MYMGETRGPTAALVHLLCDRRLKTARDGAAKESNLPSVGLPRLTGFEDRLGHRPRPLQGAQRTSSAPGSRARRRPTTSPAAASAGPGGTAAGSPPEVVASQTSRRRQAGTASSQLVKPSA